MSDRDVPKTPAATAGEPLLARWSRLKADARARETQSADPGTGRPAPAESTAHAEGKPAADTPVAPTPPIELPDIDQLDQDSDFSAFLTPGVDAALRKRALRKLFHSPKFNVFDGLDTYRDDFRSFPALGDVVTADMRHHLERAAQELAARAETAVRNGPAPGEPRTVAHDPSVSHARVGHAPPPEAPEPPATGAGGTPTVEPATARNEDDAEHGPA